MRRLTAALILAASCLVPEAASAQDDYAAILLQYLSGDGDAAVTRIARLPRQDIYDGVSAFNNTRSRQILPGAAAMHTEAALRPGNHGAFDMYQLLVATAIVEFGEEPRVKTNSTLSIQPVHAAPVSADFRRLWYCAVINIFENNAMLAQADKYLAHALVLFPHDPEVRLLAGIAEDMLASPRTANVNGGDRRQALEKAERHYRAVVATAPDRLEARLRLGRVLQMRNDLAGARAMLTP